VNAAAVEHRLWTRQEYEQMIDHGILGPEDRVELIGGEIVTVAPQKGRHAKAVGLGQDTLLSVIGSDFHVRVQLPLALGDDSEPEPNLAVIPGRRRDYGDDHPSHAVLVIEVADSSITIDRIRKGSLYSRAGIADYWVLNLVSRMLEAYRRPIVDETAPLGYAYAERMTFGPRDRVSPLSFPSASILVADLLP
jgi:hypothetical protein